MRTLLTRMDAGELREWLVEKFAFGWSGSITRSVQYAERRLAALLRCSFSDIRPELIQEAQQLREAA